MLTQGADSSLTGNTWTYPNAPACGNDTFTHGKLQPRVGGARPTLHCYVRLVNYYGDVLILPE